MFDPWKMLLPIWALLLSVIIAGCGANPTQVVAVKAEPLERPVMPAICHADARLKFEQVRKVKGNRTPPRAMGHALQGNKSRIERNYATARACECFIATDRNAKADKERLKGKCDFGTATTREAPST